MKLIVAIIRPERLEAVQAALNERDVYLMTVATSAAAAGSAASRRCSAGPKSRSAVPKLKLEIAVNDASSRPRRGDRPAARTPETGQIGDGKIFVLRWTIASASAPANAAARRSDRKG